MYEYIGLRQNLSAAATKNLIISQYSTLITAVHYFIHLKNYISYVTYN